MLIFVFASCKQSTIKQSFSSADSLVIHFKDEQAGVITKTVQSAESKAINRMVEFMDAKETELFYKKGQKVNEVDFKMKNDSCNHFAFLLNGKLTSTKMSGEAIDFLNALEQGLPIYY
jgi:hypothetical protein